MSPELELRTIDVRRYEHLDIPLGLWVLDQVVDIYRGGTPDMLESGSTFYRTCRVNDWYHSDGPRCGRPWKEVPT